MGFPAEDWPKMRETFYKLCGDDPACAPRLADWKKKISAWSDPSDSGWCRHIISGKEFDIDAKHPAPWKDKNGKPMAWKDIYESMIGFPAKQGWAPLKTWIQTNCRKTKKCPDGVGNWESTVDAIDKKVKK